MTFQPSFSMIKWLIGRSHFELQDLVSIDETIGVGSSEATGYWKDMNVAL